MRIGLQIIDANGQAKWVWAWMTPKQAAEIMRAAEAGEL